MALHRVISLGALLNWKDLALSRFRQVFKFTAGPKESWIGLANSKLTFCLYAWVALSFVCQCCRMNLNQPFARAIRLWREMERLSGYEILSS